MRRATAVGYVVACLALAGCDGSAPERAAEPPPSTPAGVVPWADLPATHPTLPTRTIPPRPDPSAAAQAPPCRADQLAASAPGRDGAGGTLYFDYTVTLSSGEPCRLAGVPDLAPLAGGRPVAVPLRAGRDDSAYRAPVLVGGPSPVHLWLAWGENWCAPPLRVDVLRMSLTGGHLDLAGPGRTPFCNGGDGPAPITVWPFYPDGWRSSRTVSAYDRVRANGNLDLRGAAGETIDFTVTLTSPRDLVLDPCPDYSIALYGDGLARTTSYALNCAAVPYADSSGRPMLPARRPVEFAMRLTAPPVDAPKVIWSLHTPEPPAIGGRLVVSGVAD